MPDIFEFRFVVRDDEIDGQGHANNVAFVTWMQSAALAHSAELGWPSERYRREGFGWVVRAHRIEYLLPAFAGDEIVVRTWVANMKRATSLRRYEISRQSDQAILAVASTKWAMINYETRQPMRIPLEVTEAFPIIDQ